LIELYTYNLPFSRPFRSAAGAFDSRRGLLIRFRHDDIDLTAEAAPLPGFSPDTLDEVIREAKSNAAELDTFFTRLFTATELRGRLATLPQHPSLQFALSWMGAGILLRRGVNPFESVLSRPAAKQLQINEIIPQSTLPEMKRDVHHACQAGFHTFKFKAGYPADTLALHLREIHKELSGDLRFRLDANRSWPCDAATETVSLFDGLPIEYIEEPCRFETDDQIRQLARSSSIPIALDESAGSLPKLKSALKLDENLYYILKPTILGNLFDLFETITAQKTPSDRIIVTTALESAAGRQMTAGVAAWIGSHNHAHGLNTGRFFREDLATSDTFGKSTHPVPEHLFYDLRFTELDTTRMTNIPFS
jgi:o-succinylbenzoate synthase